MHARTFIMVPFLIIKERVRADSSTHMISTSGAEATLGS